MPNMRRHFRNEEIQESAADELQDASLGEEEAGVHTMLCSGEREKSDSLGTSGRGDSISTTQLCLFTWFLEISKMISKP